MNKKYFIWLAFVGVLAVLALALVIFRPIPPAQIIEKTVIGEGSSFEHGITTGIFTQGGSILATSTIGATDTLTEAELANNHAIIMTPNLVAFTFTLPATSTLKSLLPKAGDSRQWFITNGTTTAAITITLVKGAGWNLIGDDANVDAIAGAAWGSQVTMVIDCMRQADTDILCFINEGIAAD